MEWTQIWTVDFNFIEFIFFLITPVVILNYLHANVTTGPNLGFFVCGGKLRTPLTGVYRMQTGFLVGH